MATLFLAEAGGARLIGMVITPEDLEALADGDLVMVKLSPTAQATLETKADALALWPSTEADAEDLARQLPGSMIVDEKKPH